MPLPLFRFLLAGLSGLFTMTLLAAPPSQGPFEFSESYVRASMPGQTVGAAYITILNRGATADYLIGAQSPVAGAVDLHSSQMQQGMAHMQREARWLIPAGGKLEMRPGGNHLMLEDLRHPLQDKDQVSIQLLFEKAGALTLSLPVRSVLSQPGPEMHMH